MSLGFLPAANQKLSLRHHMTTRQVFYPVTFPALHTGINLLPIWALMLALAIDARAAIRQAFARSRSRSLQQQTLVSCAVGGYAKRLLDILVAGTALVLLSPALLMVAVLIKLGQGGPMIFSHQRVGQTGKLFPCFKFRTMVTNGDEVLAAYLAANPRAAKQWRDFRKLDHDPRVTGLGRFLRKTSLDELPQLINVLRGEMSCVGPRPIVTAELEQYGEMAPYYLAGRPGVTGVWQVSGRNRLTYDDRVALDVYYVSHWSIWLDLRIMLMTIPAVLRVGDTA
jgi:exopolysaccharide production protein ExoY